MKNNEKNLAIIVNGTGIRERGERAEFQNSFIHENKNTIERKKRT